MEPIPETTRLVEEFGSSYSPALLRDLESRAASVTELVPDLVGVTVARLDEGVAFTLVASDTDVALLDAVQYVAGGPCVTAARDDRVVEYHFDAPVDERRWQTFARATAATAVATTLTLPVQDGERVVGTVNLYAASTRAFDGLHEEIAEVFDAWAPGAVTNADLSFRTRRLAEQAPDAARAATRIDQAVHVLVASESLDADTARRMLEEAAQRAGVGVVELAETVLEVASPPEEG